MGQAAVVADATNVGQNGNTDASKRTDTAATHFAGDHIITLLEQYRLAFLTAICFICQHWQTRPPCVTTHNSPQSETL